jgi:hypothetical protein
MKLKIILLTGILGFLLISPGFGDRKNFFSTSIDLVGAIDNNPTVTGLGQGTLQGDYRWTLGGYPSLQLHSVGPRSNFQVSYAYGYNAIDSELDLDSQSHNAGLNWTFSGERIEVSLTDSFMKAPDFSTFNFFRGILFTPEGIFFDYETVALRRDSYNNNAAFDLRYRTTEHSSISFNVGHSFRQYEESLLGSFRLPDQNQLRAGSSYIWQINDRSEFDVGYDYNQFNYKGGFYENGFNHDLTAGFNYKVSDTVNLRFGAGPSYAGQFNSINGYWGYNVDFSFSKMFEEETISVYYTRRNGASIGIGSVSKTHQAGFNFNRRFGSYTTLTIGISAFDTERALDNLFDIRGYRVSSVLGINLSRNWLINFGASYNKQEEDSILSDIELNPYQNFDRTRFFVSIRFLVPEFWRF